MTNPAYTTAAFCPQSDSVAIFGLAAQIPMVELPRAQAEQLYAALGTALHAPHLAAQQADMFAAMQQADANVPTTRAELFMAITSAQRNIVRATENAQGKPELRRHTAIALLKASAACLHAATMAEKLDALSEIATEEPLP